MKYNKNLKFSDLMLRSSEQRWFPGIAHSMVSCVVIFFFFGLRSIASTRSWGDIKSEHRISDQRVCEKQLCPYLDICSVYEYFKTQDALFEQR